jgi:hypothetical protein
MSLMVLPWYLVWWRLGSDQARCAGGGRATPAPTRRVGAPRGALGGQRRCPEGHPQDAQRPEGHPQDIKPRPENAPHKPHTARPARETGSATKRARPHSGLGHTADSATRRTQPHGGLGHAAGFARRAVRGGQAPRKEHRWIQVERLEGALQDLAGAGPGRPKGALQGDQRPEGAPRDTAPLGQERPSRPEQTTDLRKPTLSGLWDNRRLSTGKIQNDRDCRCPPVGWKSGAGGQPRLTTPGKPAGSAVTPPAPPRSRSTPATPSATHTTGPTTA